MSLDVDIFLPNVPVDLVMNDIARKSISDDVAFEAPFYKKLFKLGNEVAFPHNGKYFSQIDGMAIRNLLGFTFANSFLGMMDKIFK